MIAKCSQKSECTSSGNGIRTTTSAMARIPGVFIAGSCALAEEAGRAEQQNRDEDHEDADLAEVLPQEQAAQGFREPDHEAADERAREATHAAQHHDSEGDHHEALADAGVRVV